MEMSDPAGTKGDDVNDVTTAYAAFVIPQIWKWADAAPVIINSKKKCSGDKNEVSDKFIHTWLPQKGLKDYWACFEGTAYYLVSAPKKEAEGCNGGDCKTVQFKTLPGVSELDGKKWGTLKFEDIIIG